MCVRAQTAVCEAWTGLCNAHVEDVWASWPQLAPAPTQSHFTRESLPFLLCPLPPKPSSCCSAFLLHRDVSKRTALFI